MYGSKKTIIAQIESHDLENFEGSNRDLEALDYENAVSTQRDLEEALEADISTFEDGVAAIGESEERVETLEEGIDEMPTEALVGGVAQLEVVAGQVDDMSDSVPSLEALSADTRESVRRSLESISEKLKNAWEKLKQFFRGIWNKIKQLFLDAVLWIGDQTKKADALKKLVAKKGALKSTAKAEDVQKSLGNKLMANMSLSGKYEINGVGGKLDKAQFKAAAATSTGMSGSDINNAAKYFKGMPALTPDEHFVVTRMDGANLRGIIVSNFDGKTGYKSYVSTTLTDTAIAGLRESFKTIPGLDKIAIMIDNAKQQIKGMEISKKALYAEMENVNKNLSKEVDAVTYDQGFLKLLWTKTLGTKSFDQLSADEKVAYVRNKTSITSRMTFDVMLGTNGIVKDFLGVAKIMLDQYEDKK